MAGSSGSGGSAFLGLIVVGALLLWIYSLIAPHLWTILGALALIVAAISVVLILYGYMAGAPAGDRFDGGRLYIRRTYTWLGSFFAVVLIGLIVIPSTIMKTEGQVAHFLSIIAVLGLILAAVHGVGHLMGKAHAAYIRPYFANPAIADSARMRVRHQPADEVPGFGYTKPETASDDAEAVRRQEEAARREKARAEQERRKFEEELARRAEEELRRRRAEEDRSRSGALIRTEQEALDYLGISKPFTEKELKSRWRQMQLKVHPDQGGSNMMARSVNEAYEVLKPLAK